MNLRQAIAAGAAQLAADPQLRSSANRDAELLLLHTMAISRVTLLAYPERELAVDQQIVYEHTIARRLQHEPIQYITGRQEFYGLAMRVTPAVLIPRPETELLVEAVLRLLPADRPVRIADVGTGSGAIAIALAVHLPHAEVTAIDLSAAALTVAAANADEHGVANRIQFVESNLFAGIDCAECFDAVVSNPPYIPEGDREGLSAEVRDFEPGTALFAGESGLDVYRLLIPEAGRALKPGGLLGLEIGHGQEGAVTSLLAGWEDVSFIEDLQLIPRVALARWPLKDNAIR